MKKIEIFAPEDIEFDLSALKLESYYMPGDIPTEKIIKLLALEQKYKNIKNDDDPEEIINQMKKQACMFFEDNHTKEEMDKLKNKLGFSSLMQVIAGIYETMAQSGEDIKNLRNRAKKKAREASQK